MTTKERVTCRLCRSERLTTLFSLGNLYVSNFVPESEVKAGYLNCPRAPLEAVLCADCTLVQLRHTAPQELLYTRRYWFKSGGSVTNTRALKNLALDVQDRARLEAGDVVLDIGSNDGTLLRSYDVGLTKVGVEPADNLATQENYDGLTLIHDFWSEAAWRRGAPSWPLGTAMPAQPKAVTAAGMLYDLDDPLAFVTDVAKVLHPDGLFVAQLTCLRQTVERNDLGNYCHEHLLYFSLRSLRELYDRARLDIVDVEQNDVNGGSYRLWAVPKGQRRHVTAAGLERLAEAEEHEAVLRLDHPGSLNRHYQEMLTNAQETKALLLRAKAQGKRIVVYGASTKGNSILQFAGLDSTLIEAAADKDSEKWGKFTVGTGIPIVSPEAMRHMGPDLLVVLPHAFRREIMDQEREQTWRVRGGRFVFVLPKLEVV